MFPARAGPSGYRYRPGEGWRRNGSITPPVPRHWCSSTRLLYSKAVNLFATSPLGCKIPPKPWASTCSHLRISSGGSSRASTAGGTLSHPSLRVNGDKSTAHLCPASAAGLARVCTHVWKGTSGASGPTHDPVWAYRSPWRWDQDVTLASQGCSKASGAFWLCCLRGALAPPS